MEGGRVGSRPDESMISMSYFDILRLAAPEAILVVAALVLLAVDLGFLKGTSERTRWQVLAAIAVGGCLICLDRFHPRSWWASVRAARATCLHYLGVMPSMLMGAEQPRHLPRKRT